MTISEVYDRYQIMPSLQSHMLRVAGVAKIICDHLHSPIDTENVILASLLHDMGNILKFDLLKYPDFLEPEGLEFWQKVKANYLERYGSDEYAATQKIVAELPVSGRVRDLVAAVGFDNLEADLVSGDVAKMICEYSDNRVTPTGVTSLEDRLQDLEIRYGSRYSSPEDVQKRQHFQILARELEHQLFIATDFKPENITDSTVDTYQPILLLTQVR